jgi:hypothetical protein
MDQEEENLEGCRNIILLSGIDGPHSLHFWVVG